MAKTWWHNLPRKTTEHSGPKSMWNFCFSKFFTHFIKTVLEPEGDKSHKKISTLQQLHQWKFEWKQEQSSIVETRKPFYRNRKFTFKIKWEQNYERSKKGTKGIISYLYSDISPSFIKTSLDCLTWISREKLSSGTNVNIHLVDRLFYVNKCISSARRLQLWNKISWRKLSLFLPKLNNFAWLCEREIWNWATWQEKPWKD